MVCCCRSTTGSSGATVGNILVKTWYAAHLFLSPRRVSVVSAVAFTQFSAEKAVSNDVFPLNLAVVCVCRIAAPAPRSCAALPALGGKAC